VVVEGDVRYLGISCLYEADKVQGQFTQFSVQAGFADPLDLSLSENFIPKIATTYFNIPIACREYHPAFNTLFKKVEAGSPLLGKLAQDLRNLRKDDG
jgi:hypothetical protein